MSSVIKIIDAHTHIYPDKIAEKASHSIADFYSIKVRHDGTVGRLLELEDEAGVSKCVVHSVATTPSQVGSINRFIARTVDEHPDRFYGFATLHPDDEHIEEQIDDAIKLDLCGIKLHPDFQRFYIDGPKAIRLLEAVDGRIPVLVHAGDYRTEYSKPARLLAVSKRFPKLDIIAAHMGGWSEWNESIRALADSNIYVDTSSCQGFIKPEKMRELIENFDINKILFGTDYPMWTPADEIRMLDCILNNDEREKIYYKNFEKLIGKYKNNKG